MANWPQQSPIHLSWNHQQKRATSLTSWIIDLIATNTRFQNQPNRLRTHRSPCGFLSQLDYILVRRKWKKSIKNCWAYTSFTSMISNHKMVSAKLQLSSTQSKPPVKDPMKQINWRTVSSDNKQNEAFTIRVHNRYTALNDRNIEIASCCQVFI